MTKQKTTYCNELILGTAFENQPFVLEGIGHTSNDKIAITLSDRSGIANGCISKTLAAQISLEQCIGKVFFISAAVLVEMKQPLIVIRSISECTEYQPAELFSGLSEQMIAAYTKNILELKARVKGLNYRKLLDVCLSDANLSRLSKLPASLNGHGLYVGGCLAATAVVTDLALYDGARYAKLANGIYTVAPNWDLLITAGLLHTYGMFRFFDENDPFKKSVMGVRMNYFPILQSSLERTMMEQDITLTDEEFGNLINVLQVAVGGKTATKAITKDGSILRHTISLYRECDMMDYIAANHLPVEGESFFYDRRSRRYFINQTNEMEDS